MTCAQTTGILQVMTFKMHTSTQTFLRIKKRGHFLAFFGVKMFLYNVMSLLYYFAKRSRGRSAVQTQKMLCFSAGVQFENSSVPNF